MCKDRGKSKGAGRCNVALLYQAEEEVGLQGWVGEIGVLALALFVNLLMVIIYL